MDPMLTMMCARLAKCEQDAHDLLALVGVRETALAEAMSKLQNAKWEQSILREYLNGITNPESIKEIPF